MRVFAIASLAVASTLLASVACAAPAPGMGTWETTLKARDIKGKAVALSNPSALFFYDTVLDVTWLRDMNSGAGSPFDDHYAYWRDPLPEDYTDGRMTWRNAMAWADSLSYTIGGKVLDEWRLPRVVDSGQPGCQQAFGGTDCGYNVQTEVNGRFSEWAHLYFVTLGNVSVYDEQGVRRPGFGYRDWGLVNTGYFENFSGYPYWSETDFAPIAQAMAWDFYPLLGRQDYTSKWQGLMVTAVHAGDVLSPNSVPEPQTLALVLTALTTIPLIRKGRVLTWSSASRCGTLRRRGSSAQL